MNEPRISWTGPAGWHARSYLIQFGPSIERACLTKTGARLGAWWRRVRGRTP